MIPTDTAVDVAVGGTLVPLAIAVVNQCHWPRSAKGVVAFGLCLAAAAVLAYLRGTLDVAHWRDAAIAVTGSALAMYHLWWHPTGIGPGIEAATTIGAERDRRP